jgi:peptide/nickel transport system substrate-binding protein
MRELALCAAIASAALAHVVLARAALARADTKRAAVTCTAAACAVAILAGCSHSDGTTGGAAAGGNRFTKPHELRVVLLGDVSNLNELLATELQASWLNQLVMAWLVRYDRNNRPIPELATTVPTVENGGISGDGKTITYDLRRNVVWSDGKPFTADDVAFTVKLINDPKTNVISRLGWDDIVKVDEPNPHRIVFHLKSPFSPFVAQAFASGGGSPPILPKHLLFHTANINTDPYNALPVGIGPFKFVRWLRGDRIEMAANPAYWRGRPKLDRIVFKIIPNRDTILSELQTGDVDLWPIAPAAYLSRLQALPGHRVLRQPSFSFSHLDFNLSHAVLADPAVRRALFLALDRRALRAKVSHGVGVLQDAILSPRSPYYDAHLGFTEKNVAKANVLLDGAGWKRGSDGIRAKNGRPLTIEVVSNTGSPDTDERVELIRQDWLAIGVSFTRRNYDPNLLLANNGIIFSGKFDVAFFAWFPPGTGDISQLYSCKQFPPRGQNDSRWCNPRAEAAMRDFLATNDFARRKRDNDTLQRELVRDVPTIVLAVNEDLYAENSDLVGFHPNNVSLFDDFMKVDI